MIKNLFTKFFVSPVTEDQKATLDHVEAPAPDNSKRAAKRHARALEKAAAKYGKPWKCGPSNQAREVFIKQELTITAVIKGQEPAPPANVKPIKRSVSK